MFWQSIAPMMAGYKLSVLAQLNDNGTVTAIIVPQVNGKEKKNNLAPMTLTGTPEEFDSPEIITAIKNALLVAKDKVTNINMFIKSLEELEAKKKKELDDKKKTSSSSSSKSASKPGTSKKMKTVPNPDYIPPDKRNAENPDYDEESYDEDEPETIEVEDTEKEDDKQIKLI